MSYYNWPAILEKKTDSEIINIFTGEQFIGYEAELYASFEIIKRGLEIKNFKERIKQKIIMLKQDLHEFENYKFVNSKQFKYLIINLLILIIYGFVLGMSFVTGQNQIYSENGIFYFYNMLIILGSLFLNFVFFRFYKRNLRNQIENKMMLIKRLSDLKIDNAN